MKVGKVTKRIIALLLTVSIVGTGSGISTMADSMKATNKTTKTAEQKEETLSAEEIAQQIADGSYKGKKLKETKYYDTYEASDGSIVAAYYSSPVRFEDENGKLKAYDSNLIEADDKQASVYTGDAMSGSYKADKYAYVNTAGNSKQYFPEDLNKNTPILMEKDQYSLSLNPVIDSREEKAASVENVEDEESISEKKEISADNAVKSEADKIEYIKDDVTYQYVSMDNGVKENIIISEQPENLTYSFSYTLDGMYMKLDKKTNIIGLYDSKTDKEVAVIPAAYLNDSTGTNYNYDIKTKIKNNGNTWIIEYSLPESYMNDKNTSYPVTLDPTVEWITYENTDNPLGISFVIELSPGSGDVCQYPNSLNRFVIGRSGAGDYYKTYIQFNKLNQLLRGKQVNYAYAYVNVAQQVGGDMTVKMHEVTQDWKLSTLKWENEPEVDSEVLSQAVIGTEDQSYQIDFTKYCTMVAEEEADAMQGVELRTEERSKYMEFWGVKSQSGAPVFIVSYNSPEEINATYDGSFEISAEYNEETNKIDVSWEDSTQAATLYRVYKRTENSFEYVGKTTEKAYEVGIDDIESVADIRVMAVDQKGTQLDTTDDVNVLSNIVTFTKTENTDTDEDGNETTTVTYEQTTVDTDGDGLEDGYEIWDFKTLWNTETADSTEENPVYEQDSDSDGFPDGYEVFTLGTDPAVGNPKDENGDDMDSDGDGLSDKEEYLKKTDPWLKDSDFDNTNDRADATPRKTNGHTRQTVAAAAQVHVGLYDRQYSETEDGATYTYITNIYRGDVKQIKVDYGDTSLNKTMKYFYDAEGNNTAVIEQYDEEYDPKHTQTICITYTYDNNNVTFICDQWTKYTMSYDGENMTSLKVGNQELINYENTELMNNAGEDEDTSHLSVGDVISSDQNITTYGNGQTVKTVTTTYKVAENDTTSKAYVTKIYYGGTDSEEQGSETLSYVTEYNSEGNIIKLTDYTQDRENPVAYNYAYTEDAASVTRSDGFTKTVRTEKSEDEEAGTTTSTMTTSYGFKDVKDQKKTYTTATATTISGDDSVFAKTKLYNDDTYEYAEDSENENEVIKGKLYSGLYEKYILKTTQADNGSTSTSYGIDIYAEDKNIEYIYDLAGNITKIVVNDETKYEYSYDPHGRLTKEKDYADGKLYEYDYNETGNVQGKSTYTLDEDGKKITSTKKTAQSEYDNEQWSDQLTSYGGQKIIYDQSGNPLNYLDGMTFTWSRGRQLENITFEDDSRAVYRYNEKGLRTYKDTEAATTVYEWDDTKLIRETVTYKATGKTYDIWYFYDSNESVIGYEYSYINDQNEKSSVRIYYEKDLLGNVIGLLDSRGAEIATYAYDAWGNITHTVCYEGYETAYNLNHITYRGYYRDEESGFYYLQSRYYDSEVGRFINADDAGYLGASGKALGYNLYTYCESDPVNYVDSEGYSSYSNAIKGNNVTTTLKFWIKTIKYKYKIVNGIIQFTFSENSYWSVVWRGETRLLATAMYKAFHKKYGYNIKGRTIGGLAAELTLHWAAYKLHIKRSSSKTADMGATIRYKNRGNWGYDSNAWFFETANAISIGYRICKEGYNAIPGLIKDISRYF